MNKAKYLALLACLPIFAAGCDKDVNFPYQGRERIQFQHYTVDSRNNRYPYTTQTFSFGQIPDDVTESEAKLVVEFLGKPADYDRVYHLAIVADSTNAVEGVHYRPFELQQVFHAGQTTDTIRIQIIRQNLSKSFMFPEDKRLELKLIPGGDFDLGIEEGLEMGLLMNDYLSKPKWWDDSLTGMDYYHPKKWRILMMFNEEYSDPNTCRFNVNNEGRSYATGLRNYLNDNVITDDETGFRIMFDKLVEPEV